MFAQATRSLACIVMALAVPISLSIAFHTKVWWFPVFGVALAFAAHRVAFGDWGKSGGKPPSSSVEGQS